MLDNRAFHCASCTLHETHNPGQSILMHVLSCGRSLCLHTVQGSHTGRQANNKALKGLQDPAWARIDYSRSPLRLITIL